MQVVDVNVLVNLPMQGRFSESARSRCTRDPQWHSEPLLLIKLTNLLASVVRKLAYALTDAAAVLTHAHRIMAPGLRRVADHDVPHAAAHFGACHWLRRALSGRGPRHEHAARHARRHASRHAAVRGARPRLFAGRSAGSDVMRSRPPSRLPGMSH